MKKFFLAAAGALLAAAAGAQSPVHVDQPWVRTTVEQQTTTGAFMTLTAARDLRLVSARSPAAATVEIHEMKMVGEVMRMRPVEALPLPAGKPVELKSGAYHMMLMGLKQPVKAGDIVPIDLDLVDVQGRHEIVAVRAVGRLAAQ